MCGPHTVPGGIFFFFYDCGLLRGRGCFSAAHTTATASPCVTEGERSLLDKHLWRLLWRIVVVVAVAVILRGRGDVHRHCHFECSESVCG